MREPTTFKLVHGVHRHTPMPPAVRQHGWSYRLAVVLDSYVPGLADMYFDTSLFVSLLRCIDTAISAPRRRIRIVDGANAPDLVLPSVAALADVYLTQPEEDRVMPSEIMWLDGEVLIGGGYEEAWHCVGGPEIYHDSYTLSVFTKTDIFPTVLAATDAICAATPARLLGVYEGTSPLQTPMVERLWRRVLNRIP